MKRQRFYQQSLVQQNVLIPSSLTIAGQQQKVSSYCAGEHYLSYIKIGYLFGNRRVGINEVVLDRTLYIYINKNTKINSAHKCTI